jgi:hypothetical protein
VIQHEEAPIFKWRDDGICHIADFVLLVKELVK